MCAHDMPMPSSRPRQLSTTQAMADLSAVESQPCRTIHQTMAAKGMFENPLTPAEENEKVLDLIEPVLGKAGAAKLLDALWHFDEIEDLRELRALYRA